MKESEFRPIAKKMMAVFGITLNEIQKRSDMRTPDFESSIGPDKYLLELKMKGDDPEVLSNTASKLAAGELVTMLSPAGPWNTVSSPIENGVNQMCEYDTRNEFFHILWYHCEGQFPDLNWKRIHATIYGTDTLISTQLNHFVWCYFFRDSAFFRWRDRLDGVFLTTLEEGQLCINSLSPRAAKFRESGLVRRMSNALFDPARDAVEPGSFIVDCDIDRKDTEALLSHLRGKHGLDHLQVCSLSSATGIAPIARNKSD